MNNTKNIINQLTFENYLWIVFVIICIANILGDEFLKKAIKDKDNTSYETAKTIYIIVIITTILIYIYFMKRNYNDYLNHKDNQSYQIRLIGSILLFTGSVCFLYFLITAFNINDSVSNI